MYLKDDKGKPSITTTLVWVGIGTASLKLFLAGFTCCGLTFGEFSGSDYAMVVSPFLAILAHKRHVNASARANGQTQQKDE